MNRRIYYIDNLRWMTVSLLILFHAAIAYNTWGEANYIFFEAVRPIAFIVTLIDPWFMPMMFLLAGISSRFSLQKKRNKNIHQGTYAPLTFRRKKMKSWNLMKNCKNSEQMKT